MAIASINPATGELSKHFDAHTDAEIESALDRAVSAFEKHRRSSFAERAAKLQYTAEILEKDREHFARIITTEMGKLLRAAVDEIEKCALAIEKIFRDAGFDPGVFQSLLIENEAVEKIIRDPRVKAVTLTGSERAGSAVASTAGREIKKSVLELGGSDPFIVMPSAKLDDAISTGVKSRMVNSGQSCIAAKRFIIADAIYEKYVPQFVEKMQKMKLGDPVDETTEVAPLSSENILRGVDEQVQKSVAAGAKILCGGKRADRVG